MSSAILCLLLTAFPAEPDQISAPIYELSPALAASIRGQSPTYEPTPGFGPNPNAPYPYGAPPGMAPSTPPSFNGGLPSPYEVQPYQDPFLLDPSYTNQFLPLNGPEPYRFGFIPRGSYGILPKTGTSNPDVGSFGFQEFDVSLEHVQPLSNGVIFSSMPNFGARVYEGPSASDLPGSVYHLGWDLQLATPGNGPLSFQFNFNPSVNSDFAESLSSDAWQFDANAMMFYRTCPQFMFVAGVGYWDRVDDIFLPYAGVVWNPTDRWELRLLWPKGRVSYFLGNFWQGSHWLYVDHEYHVEAYQIGTPGGQKNQVQLTDYRLALGVRSDHGFYEKYLEAVYVFGRDVDYKYAGQQDFKGDDAFMFRAGIRF